MKKDYSVLLVQLDGNLASKLSSHQVESREPNNLSSRGSWLGGQIESY